MGQGALGQFSKSPPATPPPGALQSPFLTSDPRKDARGGLREKRMPTPLPGASACRAQTCPSAPPPGPKRPGAGLRPLGAENLSSKPLPKREEECPKHGKRGTVPWRRPRPCHPCSGTATPGPGFLLTASRGLPPGSPSHVDSAEKKRNGESLPLAWEDGIMVLGGGLPRPVGGSSLRGVLRPPCCTASQRHRRDTLLSRGMVFTHKHTDDSLTLSDRA